MALRRKEMKNCLIGFQDGFKGTGAVNDATLAATDTIMGVDTLAGLPDSATIVPVGARFTTAGILTIRTVTSTQNSQQWNLTNGGASAGTFTLTLNTETTAGIAYDATMAAVQSALEALASVTAGDVVVSGSDGGPWIITMAGDLANISTNTLTYDGGGLTGGPGVLSVVQDGTTTWEVGFTPAIVTGSVPVDDDVITWLPQRVTMEPGTGNFDWTENDDPVFDTNRDQLDGVRSGVEQPMDINTAFVFDWLRASSGQPITPYEALHRIGGASGWYTASANPCAPYCVEIFIEDIPPCGSEEAEVLIFPEFYKTSINPDVQGGLVSLTGRCNATKPTITRVPSATVLGV